MPWNDQPDSLAGGPNSPGFGLHPEINTPCAASRRLIQSLLQNIFFIPIHHPENRILTGNVLQTLQIIKLDSKDSSGINSRAKQILNDVQLRGRFSHLPGSTDNNNGREIFIQTVLDILNKVPSCDRQFLNRFVFPPGVDTSYVRDRVGWKKNSLNNNFSVMQRPPLPIK